MTYSGKVRNGVVVLDNGADLAEGTVVRVDVTPDSIPLKGTRASLLRLAGTLSDEEADTIQKTAAECRRIDQTLWNGTR